MMPALARLGGGVVCMYFDDHDPPHVHLRSADVRARFEISSGAMLDSDGTVPRRLKVQVQGWIESNRDNLQAAWDHASTGHSIPTIEWN